MLVVAGNSVINLKNTSRISIEIEESLGYSLIIGFDFMRRYFQGVAILHSEWDREIGSELVRIGECIENSGKHIGYVLAQWLKENAEKDDIISIYRMAAEILENFDGAECRKIVEYLRGLDEEDRKMWK